MKFFFEPKNTTYQNPDGGYRDLPRPAESIVREVLQNTWDARIDGKKLKLTFDFATLDEKTRNCWKDVHRLDEVNNTKRRSQVKNGLIIQIEPPESLLIIADNGARGLTGPHTLDKCSDDLNEGERYAGFVLKIGNADNKESGRLGSYGYGKLALYHLSLNNRITVFSRPEDGEPLLVTCCRGKPFAGFTGNIFWGQTEQDATPVTGYEAVNTATKLGIARHLPEGTNGTVFAIWDPQTKGLASSSSEEDFANDANGTEPEENSLVPTQIPPDIIAAIESLRAAVDWYWWPITGNPTDENDGRRPLTVEFCHNGQKQPRTSEFPALISEFMRAAYGDAKQYDTMKKRRGGASDFAYGQLRTVNPFQNRTLVELVDNLPKYHKLTAPDRIRNLPREKPVAVCAMTTANAKHPFPEMVCYYSSKDLRRHDNAQFVSVFFPKEEYAGYFRDAEPPEHNKFEIGSLNQKRKSSETNDANLTLAAEIISKHEDNWFRRLNNSDLSGVGPSEPGTLATDIAGFQETLGRMFGGLRTPGGTGNMVPPPPPGDRQVRPTSKKPLTIEMSGHEILQIDAPKGLRIKLKFEIKGPATGRTGKIKIEARPQSGFTIDRDESELELIHPDVWSCDGNVLTSGNPTRISVLLTPGQWQAEAWISADRVRRLAVALELDESHGATPNTSDETTGRQE